MTRHTQIPDTYELFLDFLKTSINNQNKICLSDSQIICTQIVKAIISIWNQLIVAQFKLDASKLNSSLIELGPAQPQLVTLSSFSGPTAYIGPQLFLLDIILVILVYKHNY